MGAKGFDGLPGWGDGCWNDCLDGGWYKASNSLSKSWDMRIMEGHGDWVDSNIGR
jgi:hypothetical protein